MMPTSLPARATGRCGCARDAQRVDHLVGGRELVDRDRRLRHDLARLGDARDPRSSAFTTSVSLTKPTTEPSASTTGTPPMRSATSVAAIATSGVSGATVTTRSVIMLRACPFTPATRTRRAGTASIGGRVARSRGLG